jgi:predicted aconitase with swiveling domain
MGVSYQADILIDGEAQGEIMRLGAPISFWGGVDPVSSEIILAGHPQYGQKICGKILVIPTLIGSSSSSAILLELIYAKAAPLALILGGCDAILPIGSVVASQMGWGSLPIISMKDPPFKIGESISITLGAVIAKTS